MKVRRVFVAAAFVAASEDGIADGAEVEILLRLTPKSLAALF